MDMPDWRTLLAPLLGTPKPEGRVEDPARIQFENALRSRDSVSEDVVKAMLAVPREEFVDAQFQAEAYVDRALPIGHRGTISQPTLVAKMISLLDLRNRKAVNVLDVGSGSGYTSAILSILAKRVTAVERVESLATQCETRLNRLGFNNVDVVVALEDALGYPRRAPYDAILVSAGAPEVPKSLVKQLAPSASMVIPVGARHYQKLAIVKRNKEPDEFTVTYSTECRFVPLIGPDAWPEDVLDFP